MDTLEALPGLLATLFGFAPAQWVAVYGGLILVLGALRTLLQLAEGALYALDIALDGESNWRWVGRLGDGARALDKLLSYLPAKSLVGSDRKNS